MKLAISAKAPELEAAHFNLCDWLQCPSISSPFPSMSVCLPVRPCLPVLSLHTPVCMCVCASLTRSAKLCLCQLPWRPPAAAAATRSSGHGYLPCVSVLDVLKIAIRCFSPASSTHRAMDAYFFNPRQDPPPTPTNSIFRRSQHKDNNHLFV